jgi:hypothetical protein
VGDRLEHIGTYIHATPALLDGWCGSGVDDKGGRLLIDGESQTVQDLAGRGYDYQWYGEVALIRLGWDDVSPILLDLARPEVQDRVCRALCGHPEVELRVSHLAWTFVIIAHAWGSPIVASGSLPGQHVPVIPALATCTTLPEALAVWWAHHVAKETP